MYIHIFFIITILWSFVSVQAADVANGKQLTEQHCTSCHGTESYTKQDRSVQSLADLYNRIQMCTQAQKLNWQDKEVEDVTAYLNEAFYHF